MKNWFYMISIAFQLSGAILLIIKYWFGSAKDQLTHIQNKRTRDEGGGNIIMGDSLPSDQEFIEELWLSRIAFLYIAVGYMIGIWGNVDNINKCFAAFMILFMSCLFVIIGKVISYSMGKPFQIDEKC